MKSEVAPFLILLFFKAQASLIEPQNNNNFSVSVVFPASGCEMIPNVLLRCISFKKLIYKI
jgi:hypothetical protein